jgi:factor VIII intron 22 protein
MDVNYDYSGTFKSISVKLKKRFLRKPNVADAIDEYTLLSRQLENEECFGLAGYCMQQVAKSYHSVGNTVAESASLQTAAKHYLNAEIAATIETGSLTFNEDLLSAISIYEEAIQRHVNINERHLGGKLSLELADLLTLKFERYFEAIPYYEK